MGGLGTLSVAGIGFAAPWVLVGLAALPMLWWLLRVMPPPTRLVRFPALVLLLGLQTRQQQSSTTPWWLLLLRMVVAALVIIGLAGPVTSHDRAAGALQGHPVVLVMDTGWAAASDWPDRLAAAESVLARADRLEQPVTLLATAPPPDGRPIRPVGPLTAAEALSRVRSLQPQPWATDRAGALAAIEDLTFDTSAHAVWIADGLDDGPAAGGGNETAAYALATRLQRFGRLDMLTAEPDLIGQAPAIALMPPERTETGFVLRLRRAARDSTPARTIAVTARDADGLGVARSAGSFEAGAADLAVSLELPTELANRATAIALDGHATAGAVRLLDERWRRRPAGLVSGDPIEAGLPLLGDTYFVDRALAPFATVRRGEIDTLLERPLAVLVLSDVASIVGDNRDRLISWVDGGGVLVRFAGPNMAGREAERTPDTTADPLLPVRLRAGDRTLGGAMAWSRPAALAPFEDTGPLADLPVPPRSEVTVRTQVLAEPDADLAGRTWSRLEDGTPLVTADRRGRGWVVLVHTTANAEWSDLALSGTFVEMLRRFVALSAGVSGQPSTARLVARQVLDGFGRLTDPVAPGPPVALADLMQSTPGPDRPPGYYGTEDVRHAFNLTDAAPALQPMTEVPSGVERLTFRSLSTERAFGPDLLAVAAMLLLVDLIATLLVRGLMRPADTAGTATAAVAALTIGLLTVVPAPAGAQDMPPAGTEAFAQQAALDPRLAFVRTGVGEVDRASRSGLAALTRVMARRTNAELGTPVGLDIETDPLLFFPMIYWPITPQQGGLSSAAQARINDYMHRGGMILFDTRDAGGPGAGVGGRDTLAEVADGLDIPPLTRVPSDHTLTKAFYLLDAFPGRWAGGSVWVAHAPQLNDRVSPVVIGGHDWSGAWAEDGPGQPMYPAVPGGARQREMAFRFGINLVMYALTGNYKADQVHGDAIRDRLRATQ